MIKHKTRRAPTGKTIDLTSLSPVTILKTNLNNYEVIPNIPKFINHFKMEDNLFVKNNNNQITINSKENNFKGSISPLINSTTNSSYSTPNGKKQVTILTNLTENDSKLNSYSINSATINNENSTNNSKHNISDDKLNVSKWNNIDEKTSTNDFPDSNVPIRQLKKAKSELSEKVVNDNLSNVIPKCSEDINNKFHIEKSINIREDIIISKSNIIGIIPFKNELHRRDTSNISKINSSEFVTSENEILGETLEFQRVMQNNSPSTQNKFESSLIEETHPLEKDRLGIMGEKNRKYKITSWNNRLDQLLISLLYEDETFRIFFCEKLIYSNIYAKPANNSNKFSKMEKQNNNRMYFPPLSLTPSYYLSKTSSYNYSNLNRKPDSSQVPLLESENKEQFKNSGFRKDGDNFNKEYTNETELNHGKKVNNDDADNFYKIIETISNNYNNKTNTTKCSIIYKDNLENHINSDDKLIINNETSDTSRNHIYSDFIIVDNTTDNLNENKNICNMKEQNTIISTRDNYIQGDNNTSYDNKNEQVSFNTKKENVSCNIQNNNVGCNIKKENVRCNIQTVNVGCNNQYDNVRCNIENSKMSCNIKNSDVCYTKNSNFSSNIENSNFSCNIENENFIIENDHVLSNVENENISININYKNVGFNSYIDNEGCNIQNDNASSYTLNGDFHENCNNINSSSIWNNENEINSTRKESNDINETISNKIENVTDNLKTNNASLIKLSNNNTEYANNIITSIRQSNTTIIPINKINNTITSINQSNNTFTSINQINDNECTKIQNDNESYYDKTISRNSLLIITSDNINNNDRISIDSVDNKMENKHRIINGDENLSDKCDEFVNMNAMIRGAFIPNGTSVKEFKEGIYAQNVQEAHDILTTKNKLGNIQKRGPIISWSRWNVRDIVRGPHVLSSIWKTTIKQIDTDENLIFLKGKSLDNIEKNGDSMGSFKSLKIDSISILSPINNTKDSTLTNSTARHQTLLIQHQEKHLNHQRLLESRFQRIQELQRERKNRNKKRTNLQMVLSKENKIKYDSIGLSSDKSFYTFLKISDSTPIISAKQSINQQTLDRSFSGLYELDNWKQEKQNIDNSIDNSHLDRRAPETKCNNLDSVRRSTLNSSPYKKENYISVGTEYMPKFYYFRSLNKEINTNELQISQSKTRSNSQASNFRFKISEGFRNALAGFKGNNISNCVKSNLTDNNLKSSVIRNHLEKDKRLLRTNLEQSNSVINGKPLESVIIEERELINEFSLQNVKKAKTITSKDTFNNMKPQTKFKTSNGTRCEVLFNNDPQSVSIRNSKMLATSGIRLEENCEINVKQNLRKLDSSNALTMNKSQSASITRGISCENKREYQNIVTSDNNYIDDTSNDSFKFKVDKKSGKCQKYNCIDERLRQLIVNMYIEQPEKILKLNKGGITKLKANIIKRMETENN